MNYPKINNVQAIDERTLKVEFDNQQVKKYDITPLLNREMFQPLKNPALFKSVQVEKGGYAVSWSKEIDISEYELWCNGEPVT
jgi:hypothetical protein